MNLLYLPWLEFSIAATLLGAPFVSRLRDPGRAYRWAVAFIGVTFACAFLAWLAFYVGVTPEQTRRWSLQPRLFGRQVFALDELEPPRWCRRSPCSIC